MMIMLIVNADGDEDNLRFMMLLLMVLAMINDNG